VKPKYTGDIRTAYHIYTILDRRNRKLYVGYTLHALDNKEYLFGVEPDFLCAGVHQYMWQEGLEHFVYNAYPISDHPPTCIQDKRDADFMKKQVVAQIHDWNYLMSRHSPEHCLPLVKYVLLDDDITFEAKEVVVIPKERVAMGEISQHIVFDALADFYK